MKRIATAVFLLGGAYALTLNCACGPSAPTAEVVAAATETAVLDVQGMTCASCSVTVRTAVNRIEGIGSVEVDVNAGRATVTYDGTKADPQQIANAITATGYAASVVSDQATSNTGS